MFSHLKLQHILFLTFTLIASLPVMILGYWVQRVALENEVIAVEEKHLLVAKKVTRDLNRYIIDVDNSFNLVISNLLAQNKIDGLAAYFKTLDIRYIFITDKNGNIKTKIPKVLAKNNNKQKIDDDIWEKLQESIKESKITKKLSFSNLIRTGPNETTFFIVKVIKNNQIAVGSLSTNYIREVQKQISFGRRGHVAIVDRTGHTIAHPVLDWVKNMKDMSFLPPVKNMMNGETGISKFYTPAMGEDVIAGYTVVAKTGWGVMVPQPFTELVDHARSTQNTVLVIMIIGITVAGLISWFLSGLLVGPIHSVVDATKFSENDKHKYITPVKVSTSYFFIPKEFQELIYSFNSMGGRLNSITKQLYSKIDLANDEVNDQNLKLKDQARELKIINEELARLSTTDNLTNLFNRRLFDEMIDTELSFAIRHKEYLSLVVLDIDHFKSVNDKYGHIQGDKVLIDVANLLKDNCRSSDVVFRIGGEEFAILCRRTKYEESKIMVENLRISLEQHKFKIKKEVFTVTGSFGIVTIPDTDINIQHQDYFYRYADKAMYYSKNNGRNQVTHYHDIIVKTSTKMELQ
ncbi:MAG: diguanylate cyclase [Thiohalomonadales bacterium]